MYDYMCTYTGQMLKPMELKPEDISLEDISHALSLLCRGGGHLKHFYSVGQHCINCAKEAEARGWGTRVILGCLVHDAAEAYISDIIRPVKKHLPAYTNIEDKILTAVYERFGLGGLTEEELRQIRQIDNEILENEIPVLMSGSEHKFPAPLQSEPDFSLRDMKLIEETYRNLAESLILNRKKDEK